MYGRFSRPTLGLAVAVSVGLGLVLGLGSVPDGSRFRSAWPDTTAYMELRLEEAREAGHQLELRHRPIPLHRISRHLRRAVRVAEDAAFYRHPGIDIRELERAVSEAWRQKRAPRGTSTITQQLARNLYLSPDRTLWRKAREAAITLRLESVLPKERILELYLNVIELGNGVFGVQAGSIHYFGLPADRLSRRQAAMLAATIPSPRTDNPSTNTGEFRWRTELVFRRAFGNESATDTAAVGLSDTLPSRPEALPAADSVAEPVGESPFLPAPAPPDTVPEGSASGASPSVPLPPSGDHSSVSGRNPTRANQNGRS